MKRKALRFADFNHPRPRAKFTYKMLTSIRDVAEGTQFAAMSSAPLRS